VKLRQLEYFVMVADEGGFNRAAQRLHVAQPSLSVQIKTLEQEVGARLFERDKRHVFLTQAGKQFQQHARTILSLAETAKIEARCAEAGELGTLNLGYSASAMFSGALPNAIRRFRQRYPHVVLTLHDVPSLEQLHGLLERSLDLGILRKPEVRIPTGIEVTEWYRAPLVVAIQQDHPLARRPSLSLSQLRDEPFVLYSREAGTGLYWQVLDLCAHAGFRPRVAKEVLEPSTIIGLVAAGVGVAIVPDGIQCIRFEGAIYKPLTDLTAHSTLYVARRRDDPNTHLRAICDLLSAAGTPSVKPKKRRTPRPRRKSTG
jgi:DNA-binding transcriptional LysR family regulator